MRFDWAEPGTWEDVLRGIGSVYLTFAPDLAVPGASELIRAFSARAVASGVENIVLLSGRGEPQVLPSEQAVRESGARFTILRSSWFAQNFSEGHFAEQVRSGVFAFPGGDCAEPFLDIEDIADVAVAALTDSRHSGKIYELTGPRLLTFRASHGRDLCRGRAHDHLSRSRRRSIEQRSCPTCPPKRCSS